MAGSHGLGCGLDARHMDRLCRRVQRSGDCNFRSGECGWLFLVVELIGSLRGRVKQRVLAAHVYAAVGEILGALTLLRLDLVAAQSGALAVNDLAFKRLRTLGKNAQRCQQTTYADR